MENRFLDIDEILEKGSRHGSNGHSAERSDLLSSAYSLLATPLSAADRVLVILIENGGIDLNLSGLVGVLWRFLPGSSVLPDSLRSKLAQFLEKKIKSYTDNLLESAELALNRYTGAKPEFFSDVITLRDGTASFTDLKNTLIAQSKKGKLIDLFILTHGSGNFISVKGGIDGDKIRAMKSDYGKPLSIRSVYMMNCVGASLNQAWLDAGAKASAGSIKNNYLPEPTMYFFWKNWKEGQTFESAVTSAYRKTIALMNTIGKELLQIIPGGTLVSGILDFEHMDFVRDSAPMIQGQRSVTINTDNLSFAQTISSSLATTVLPVGVLRSLSLSEPDAGVAKTPGTLSQQGVDLIKGFEGFRSKLYDDAAGHCTVGYGTLVHTGKCDGRAAEAPYVMGITEVQATQLLAQKAQEFEKTINDKVQVALNQNQFDALVSFVYNVGDANFKQSTLLKVLNQGNYAAVPNELKRWTKARQNGKMVDLPGLVKRRESEAERFQKPISATAQSLSHFPIRYSYIFECPSNVVAQQLDYSIAQNPVGVVIAGIEVADAAQIGLAAVSIVQAQVSASQGSFSLSYDKAQRLLTAEARASMPGSQKSKKSYSLKLLYLGIRRWNTAKADVIIEWEGNVYGEIGTAIIRRNLQTSTEWSKSSSNITITKVDRIPLPQTDPRTWPIVYSYEGTFDPFGNGYFEFSGEFEINAFGGLKFNRHEVVSRSLSDSILRDTANEAVRRGDAVIVPVPTIPQEQIQYLKTRLP